VIGTYLTAIGVVALSALVGQAVLVLAGWRRPSWLAPATGFALLLVVSWWGASLADGAGALVALILVALLAIFVLVSERAAGLGTLLGKGVPALVVTFVAASIPFIAEGHFGVLGTGFNVDMSQHLFVAEWLREGAGPDPALISQGYPVGPHSLAAGFAFAGPNQVEAFTGVTLAIPLLAAATAMLWVGTWRPGARVAGAALIALPYLGASYYAQGSFKELAMALMLLAFALGMRELGRGEPVLAEGRAGSLRGVPLGVVTAGALYAYSGPALVWIGGAFVAWLAIEILTQNRTLGWLASGVRAPALVGAAVILALAAPEIPRIAEFSSAAQTVAEKGGEGPSEGRGVGSGGGRSSELRFNDDFGNLFPENGDLNGAEALGIWPTGDFRLEPGDGKVPGIFFFLGAVVGAVALFFGARALWRAREPVPLGALAASALIWVLAALVSTPYTAAKALLVASPLVMLVALSATPWPQGEKLIPFLSHEDQAVRVRAAVVLAFLAGAAGSSLLALGNAPVGPKDYRDALARMRSAVAGLDVVALVPPEFVSDERGDEWLAWELRGAASLEILDPSDDLFVPGDGRIVTFPEVHRPPLEGALQQRARDGYRIWFP
jgi:hypothetical protein